MTKQRSLSERPTTLKGFVASDSLKNQVKALVKDRVRAILITGETGTGKTTLSDIIANVLADKNENDISRLNFVTDNGIDTVRKLIQKIEYLPSHKRRVFVLEEFHAATKPAQEAFLNAIDHPPHDDLTFVFTTNQSHKLVRTLKDRCAKINLKSPDVNTLVSHLEALGFSNKIAKRASENAGNSFRAAIQNAQDMEGGGDSDKNFENEESSYHDKVKAWHAIIAKPSMIEKKLETFLKVCENDFMAIRYFASFTNDYLSFRLGRSTNPYLNGIFSKISKESTPLKELASLAKRSTKVYDEAREHGEMFTNRFISIFVD